MNKILKFPFLDLILRPDPRLLRPLQLRRRRWVCKASNWTLKTKFSQKFHSNQTFWYAYCYSICNMAAGNSSAQGTDLSCNEPSHSWLWWCWLHRYLQMFDFWWHTHHSLDLFCRSKIKHYYEEKNYSKFLQMTIPWTVSSQLWLPCPLGVD